MENLAEGLMEELSCETVFTIPVFGGIEVAESVVVTWIIMAFLVLLSLILTRNLKVHGISKRQAALEYCVTWLNNLVEVCWRRGETVCPLPGDCADLPWDLKRDRANRVQAAYQGSEYHGSFSADEYYSD